MAGLSIVIPVVGDLESFETTLASVLQNRPDDCEVIAAMAVAYGDPYALAGEVRFVEAPATRRWTQAAQVGMAAAQSPIVHLLQPGVEVRDGWTEPALGAMDDPAVASVSPLVVDSDRQDRVLAAGLRYGRGGVRRLAPAAGGEVLGPTRLAGFYRRIALAEVGGLCDRVGDHLADLDLALALAGAGWQAASAAQSVVAASAALLDVPGRTLSAGFYTERLYRRHLPATRGRVTAKLAHAAIVAGELLSIPLRPGNAMRLAGRLASRLTRAQRRRPIHQPTLAVTLPDGYRVDGAQKTPPPHEATAVYDSDGLQSRGDYS